MTGPGDQKARPCTLPSCAGRCGALKSVFITCVQDSYSRSQSAEACPGLTLGESPAEPELCPGAARKAPLARLASRQQRPVHWPHGLQSPAGAPLAGLGLKPSRPPLAGLGLRAAGPPTDEGLRAQRGPPLACLASIVSPHLPGLASRAQQAPLKHVGRCSLWTGNGSSGGVLLL